MLPKLIGPVVRQTRHFLDKSLDEKISAIGATLDHAVRRVYQPTGRFVKMTGHNTHEMRSRLDSVALMERERFVRELFSDPIYSDKRRLPPFGFKVYSQNDEDGIIEEIFKRIGPRSRVFVEFGTESGLENNTLKLLLEGWSGLWLEGSATFVEQINTRFQNVIEQGRLQARHAFIDRDNINDLIGASFTGEIDLLSIDIDGNDVYIWEALTVINPRVVVIEYNSKFPPSLSIAQRYDPTHRWNGTDYFGSSLAAITKIAERKGYALVGCNIAGANAFFVRSDLLEDKFCEPYTAENQYLPPRYFLSATYVVGHPAGWGAWVEI